VVGETFLRCSFVYSAVTQFDTTNTSNDSARFGGAGLGVIFRLISFASGGLRFDTLGVSFLFSGRGPASSNKMEASDITRWLRSETQVWIGNKQATTFLQQYRHMKERGKSCKYQEGRVGAKVRGLRGTKAGSVERAACHIHVPGENAPAQIQKIQIQDLAEISRYSKCAP
jgi:hypothetical protein